MAGCDPIPDFGTSETISCNSSFVQPTSIKKLSRNGVPILTIHDLDERNVLAFDVRDILLALAPRSLTARFKIMTPKHEDFWATGAGGVRLEALAEQSALITGDELLTIANDTLQVIWGDFVASLPDAPDQEWLIIRAFDSSWYEVETADKAAIAAVQLAFHDVRIGKGAS